MNADPRIADWREAWKDEVKRAEAAEARVAQLEEALRDVMPDLERTWANRACHQDLECEICDNSPMGRFMLRARALLTDQHREEEK